MLDAIPALYPEFTGIAEYDLLRRRLAQLATGEKAWLKHIGEDGRIHGAVIHIGTPHSRAKHLDPNLAQVPNEKKGAAHAEGRTLFRHPGDWVFVTCDQANLQDRAFAHHLAEFDGGAYVKEFLAGVDQHWKTVGALGLAPAGTKRDKGSKLHTAIREGAKHFRYGFLFGAGVARCKEILTETVRAVRNIESTYTAPTDGKRARDRFIAATPGLRQLRNKLETQVARHRWLPGLDGRRVPTRAQYTALNYALASIEAIVCKRWLVNVYDELCARFKYGWDGDVVIPLWVHDEIACCCRPEIAEQVGEILVRYAKEAGEYYQLKVPLGAEYKIGASWAGDDNEAAPASLHGKDGERAPAPPIAPGDIDHEADEAAQWLARNADVADIDETADWSSETAPPWEPISPAGDETVDSHIVGSLSPPVGPHIVGPPAADNRMGALPCEAVPGPAREAPAPSIVPESGAAPIGMVENGDGLGAAIGAALHHIMAGIEGSSARPTGEIPPIGGMSGKSGNGAGAPRGNGQERDHRADGGNTNAGAGAKADKADASERANAKAGTPSTDPELGPYIYRDVSGKPYARVARTPGRSSRFTQKHWTGEAWADGMPKRKLPYRLPELLAADPADLVCITEGEKDAVNVAKLGFVATTNPNGAKGWNSAKLIPYFAPLSHFVIFEDNDDPGRERTKRIVTTLRQYISAADIRVVKFPELP